jgi:hypothetical protein
MKILFFTLMLASMCTFGEEFKLYYGIDPVLHFDRSTNLNEDVDLVGISYDKWSLYSFENSYSKNSILVTKELWNTLIHQHDRFVISASVHGGIVHGYEGTSVTTIFGLLPWLFISNEFDYRITDDISIGLTLSIVPAFDSSVFAKGITLKHKF